MSLKFYLSAICLLFFVQLSHSDERPNIIIIMTDDMGFSDLGCFGAEIQTPNLDSLAKNGLRFTQFYNAGRCCPTRASLLSGLYAHQAGMGGMTEDQGVKKPGYRGRILERAVTIGEVLGPAGYCTIQTGKWHVGDKKKEWWPVNRGFKYGFSSPAGGGFYFRPSAFNQPRSIVSGEKVLYNREIDPPEGFYTTDAYTEEGFPFIREAVKAGSPFLWYLAYNAPHFPLKAKAEDIAKYRGKYKTGWDVIRKKRHEKLIELGIIKSSWELSPRPRKIPAWDSLSENQKDEQDLRMAAYAAMIDCVDQNIGRLISELKKLNVYENTLIVFLCDNGGDSSGGTLGSNKGKGEVGTAESFAYYGEAWANVSNTPFKLYKKFIHEGGISTPFIAHWPGGIKKELNNSLISEPAHLIDLMATCVDLSKAEYPKIYKDHQIIPMEGKSLNPIFKGEKFTRSDALFFEHMGNKGIRSGKWKLVSTKGSNWELYDMDKDRTELNDVAAQYPEIVKELQLKYSDWAKRSFVNK